MALPPVEKCELLINDVWNNWLTIFKRNRLVPYITPNIKINFTWKEKYFYYHSLIMEKHDIKFRSYKKYIDVISSIKVKTFHMKETTAKKGNSETTTSHQVWNIIFKTWITSIYTPLLEILQEEKKGQNEESFEEAVYWKEMKNKLQRDTIFLSHTGKLNSKAWQRHKEIGSPIVLRKLYWYRIGEQ